MLKYQGPGCSALLLTVVVILLVSASVESSPKIDGLYVHSQKQCIGCHSEEKSLQKVLSASLGKCQSCHENDNPINIPTVNSSELRKTGRLYKTSTNQKKPGQDRLPIHEIESGMRFPLYSGSSRLGDAPNQMVLIPAGKFLMGSDTRLPDEGPQHTVILPAYYIDAYEVTNLQYKKFNDAVNGRSPVHWRNRAFPQGKADHPVVFVTWDNANEYCRWTGKRLPTDQEWEKAARGTDGRMFPWGDEFNASKANTPLRWQEVGSIGDTTPVGSFEDGRSPYGLYDMSGNVWEWTESWYKAYPGNEAKSESYGERYKTLKGGSWFDCSFYKCGISAPVFNRAFFARKVKNDSFGFRCANDS